MRRVFPPGSAGWWSDLGRDLIAANPLLTIWAATIAALIITLIAGRIIRWLL